jgi:hypothetical protein
MSEATVRKNEKVPAGCLSVPQIAEQLKCSIVNVHVHIKKNHIKSFRDNNRIYVQQTDLESFVHSRKRPGRPFRSAAKTTSCPVNESVETASAAVVEENS